MQTLKDKIKGGKLVLGTIISEVRNPNIGNLLAQAGFEFFVLDMEHGAYNWETMSDIIAGARGAGIPVIVRVPEVRREAIMKPMDSGAAGILVPNVDTVELAKKVVEYAKFPPHGTRGVALRRAHSQYARVNAVEYTARANEAMFIAVQAETSEAIKNADAIAAVEGIDSVFASPFDLSVNLGVAGQVNHPRETMAITQMLDACKKHKKAGGILSFDALQLKPWIEKGMRMAVYSSDITMLADAAGDAVRDLKG
jgi:2-keto-3-deoxy-L-rhamnonate aldolase RhmA